MFGDESNQVKLGDCATIEKGKTITRDKVEPGNVPVVAAGIEPSYYHNVSNRKAGIITVSASGANAGYVNYWNEPIFASDCNTILSNNENVLNNVFLYCRLKVLQNEIFQMQRGSGQPHVYAKDLAEIEIPIPSIKSQTQYVQLVTQSDKSKYTLGEQKCLMKMLLSK